MLQTNRFKYFVFILCISLVFYLEDAEKSHKKTEGGGGGGSGKSLTRKHIPDPVWKWVSPRTSFGTSVNDCIKGAVKYPQGPGVGLVAPG